MTRLVVAVVLCLAVAALAKPSERFSHLSEEERRHLFTLWTSRYGVEYPSMVEHEYRFTVFSDTLHRVDKKNAQDPHAHYSLTKFSDLTPTEFKARYLTNVTRSGLQPVHSDAPIRSELPPKVDWRSSEGKYIGPVRNQGQCGSCWAFSTAEQIASNWALANNSFVVLSTQQIIDCDTTDSGCNGGDTPTAYQYVISAGGLESEKDYPYTGGDGTCHFDKKKVAAHISSWKYITGSGDNGDSNIQKLQTQLQLSPISICVEADTWQDYSGGIITSNCGQQLDHCVQLAGYDVSDESGSTPYWIIRNSWGTDWGIQGYLYVGTAGDLCGVQDESTVAIV